MQFYYILICALLFCYILFYLYYDIFMLCCVIIFFKVLFSFVKFCFVLFWFISILLFFVSNRVILFLLRYVVLVLLCVVLFFPLVLICYVLHYFSCIFPLTIFLFYRFWCCLFSVMLCCFVFYLIWISLCQFESYYIISFNILLLGVGAYCILFIYFHSWTSLIFYCRI